MADGKFSNFTTRPAKDFSLEITDKGGTDITIGAESGGYYPLSTSLTGKLTAGTWGRFHDGTATDNNVIVGRIKKGTCTVAGGGLTLGSASGGGLSGGGLSVTGNKTSITPTISIALSAQNTTGVGITDNKPSSGYYLTIGGSSSSDSAVVNRAKVDRAAFSQTVTRAAITDAHTAGYIPAKNATTVINSDSKTITLDAGNIAAASQKITINAGSKTRYITIPTGGCTVAGGELSGNDVTPTISIALSAQNTTGVDITNDKPTSGYYLTIAGSSTKTTASVTRAAITDAHTAGYIPAKTQATVISAATKTLNINAGSKTRYITIPSATSKYGFITSSGYISKDAQVYSATYNSTNDYIEISFK